MGTPEKHVNVAGWKFRDASVARLVAVWGFAGSMPQYGSGFSVTVIVVSGWRYAEIG